MAAKDLHGRYTKTYVSFSLTNIIYKKYRKESYSIINKRYNMSDRKRTREDPLLGACYVYNPITSYLY
jgi:hypothetical protein